MKMKGYWPASLLVMLVGVFGGVPVEAANWLMLQGTEPDSAAERAKVWGFIQAQYQKDYSDANSTDGYIPPKLIGPNLTSQSQFNVNRARIGVRGTGFPLDSSVNYFLLTEFGNNGITAADGGSAMINDASITINKIPGARVRVGLFKYPGAEEGLQAIHVFDYINFTAVSNQLLLERFPNPSYTPNNDPATLPGDGTLNGFDKPVGAFRDVGAQLFDSFKTGGWEHTYALMLGNGNGLNFGDNDDNKDRYLYWSSELPFGGNGPRAEGLKLFVWSQDGKRQLNNTNDATYNPEEFERKRQGIGVKYMKKPFRVTAEYMRGEGMIFVGPDKPTFDINPAVPGGNGEEGKANGYYLDLGFYIPNSKWQLDLRYDVFNRLTDDTDFPAGPNIGKDFQMEFITTTLGVNYHFNRKSRLTVNYEIHKAEAPDWDSGAGPNDNLDGIGNRIAAQITHIF